MATTEIYTVVPIIRTLHASVVFGSQIVESGATVHNDLSSRDVENCHPQSAITGLIASLAAKANSADLGAVATSNDYNDLDNKPTIITDAPADGLQYARKDNEWSEVEASGGASFWTELTGCTRTNDNTIATATDLTALVSIGDALRYVTGTATKYGEVKTISSSVITIKGEPIDSAISAIHVSRAGLGIIESHHFVFTGQFAMVDLTTMLNDYLLTTPSVGYPAKIISFKARCTEIDTGASPTAEAKINIVDTSGNAMFTADVQLASADTWYYSDVADTSYNTLAVGGSFEVKVLKATGTVNNDAINATVIVKTVNTNLG